MKLSPVQIDYFKDSKMRGSDGNLQIFYHGTKSEFNQFSAAHIFAEPGFWFTDSESYADYHGNKCLKVYLNIKKPFMLEDFTDEKFANYYNDCFKGAEFSENLVFSFKFRDYLIAKGYDGIIFIRGYLKAITFYSEQIKAIDNLYPTASPVYTDNTKDYFSKLV